MKSPLVSNVLLAIVSIISEYNGVEMSLMIFPSTITDNCIKFGYVIATGVYVCVVNCKSIL